MQSRVFGKPTLTLKRMPHGTNDWKSVVSGSFVDEQPVHCLLAVQMAPIDFVGAGSIGS